MIPHNRPTLNIEEEEATIRVIRSGWLTQGKEVEAFENEFCKFVGLPEGHAVAVSSGTASLFLSLWVLNAKNKKISFVYNKNYKFGMASSIKAGLKRISKKNTGFLIVQADMPLISKKIINSLCYAIENNNKEIVVPIYKRNMGNPIGFKSSMIKILNKTKGDSGEKKMIKRNKKKLSLIKVNSKSIFKDFNTQRDFLLN